MPILRFCADEDGLHLHNSPTAALPALHTAARGTGPIIIMVHGYKYDPTNKLYDPHSSIFALKPRAKCGNGALWPQALGFGVGGQTEGLAIAFGWKARGNIWQAQQMARIAGQRLGRIIRVLNNITPHRPINIISHSMGSEVAFEALKHVPEHNVARLVTLTGASYVGKAMDAMRSPAGLTTELFNVTSRENDLFDFAFERLIPPSSASDRVLGLGVALPNAVNVQLDCDQTLSALAKFGAKISTSKHRVSHWSGYTRPGAMQFFARVMRCPGATPLHAMKALLPPNNAPRWSRFVSCRPQDLSCQPEPTLF